MTIVGRPSVTECTSSTTEGSTLDPVIGCTRRAQIGRDITSSSMLRSSTETTTPSMPSSSNRCAHMMVEPPPSRPHSTMTAGRVSVMISCVTQASAGCCTHGAPRYVDLKAVSSFSSHHSRAYASMIESRGAATSNKTPQATRRDDRSGQPYGRGPVSPLNVGRSGTGAAS